MRSPEDFTEPLLHDVLVFSRGHWYRYSRVEDLPLDDPDAKYPDQAADLPLIYPFIKDAQQLADLIAKVTGTLEPRSRWPCHGMPWKSFWTKLRHLPMSAGATLGVIPQRPKAPETRVRNADGRLARGSSGTSEVESQRITSVPAYELKWKPNTIQALDYKFLMLSPTAGKVIGELAKSRKQIFSRADVRDILARSLGDRGWKVFIRYRAALIRDGFLRPIKRAEKYKK
jgi:hypothetical protein